MGYHFSPNFEKSFVACWHFFPFYLEVSKRDTIFLKQLCCLGKCTGISFIDATPGRVCHIKREKSHKVFKGLATKGKSTIVCFFGFKLHLVVNDKGEIIKFLITQVNVDDRELLNDLLKNSCQIEHTRHRCLANFVGNLVSGLIAYNLAPKKPVLNLEIIDLNAIKKVA